jgi:hypothetical protein
MSGVFFFFFNIGKWVVRKWEEEEEEEKLFFCGRCVGTQSLAGLMAVVVLFFFFSFSTCVCPLIELRLIQILTHPHREETLGRNYNDVTTK